MAFEIKVADGLKNKEQIPESEKIVSAVKNVIEETIRADSFGVFKTKARIRLKKEITEFQVQLEKILQLRIESQEQKALLTEHISQLKAKNSNRVSKLLKQLK